MNTVTRFAPSLTGYLHLGHVLHMIHVWGSARSRSGKVLSRIEDHDLSRNRPEFEPAILADMQWLGFLPDIGITAADAPGPSPYRQSDCTRHYQDVLDFLEERGLVYGCACSRREMMQVLNGGTQSPASALWHPSGQMDSEDAVSPRQFQELCYPGTCACRNLPLEGNTVRFRLPDGPVDFIDLALGDCRQEPKRQCGDFPLRDRHGQWTYQFCCVCDDIRHGINLVVRGEDILSSTGRQIRLFEALGHPPPRYLHHRLLCDEAGRKLSKRQRSESITRLRGNGVGADEIIGRAGHAGGLISKFRPLSADAAIALFNGL